MKYKKWLIVFLCVVCGSSYAGEQRKITEDDWMVLHNVWRAVQTKNTMGNYQGYELTEIVGLAEPSLQGFVTTLMKTESQSVLNKNSEVYFESLKPAYLQYYTEAELVELADFYRSDIGKKLVELQGVIGKKIRTKAQAWRERMQPQVVNHIIDELLKTEEVKNKPQFAKAIKTKRK